jgi:predicted glutamine amidotransferase
MSTTGEAHECDLFLLSSHIPYVADRILPAFARKGCHNIHGWGIGSYTGSEARVVRRAEPAFNDDTLSTEFAMAVEVISSPIILGHLRLTSCGKTRAENNHPFRLDFLGYDWLLVHNGTARRHEHLVPRAERILAESDNDTPRIFEFLRREIIEYYESRPQRSLIEACRSAFGRLAEADPEGKFNLILSNGFLSFVFVHWRTFYLLCRPKQTGNVALISTIERLTDIEDWVRFDRSPSKKGRMLVFSGPTLILNGDIPP